MAKMTKTQAKKRLNEAKAKVKAVYVNEPSRLSVQGIVSTADMAAIEKILDKCLKRLS
tara:strand:+ start:3557 stop:3730 length:174 start_codon:yes stop_codon:yes gene_type:complete